VWSLNVGGKEFDVAPAGLVAETGDERRHYIGAGRGGKHAGLDDGGELVGHPRGRTMLPGGAPASLCARWYSLANASRSAPVGSHWT
jgi:hypothetical protein